MFAASFSIGAGLILGLENSLAFFCNAGFFVLAGYARVLRYVYQLHRARKRKIAWKFRLK